MKVIIVGGVAGGASAAARLRRLNEDAQIVVFERSGYVSYANCGLPYYVGGTITDREALTLQTPESFKRRFNVDVRVRCEVRRIDPVRKTVTVCDLSTGAEYEESYDRLILSPGARPVRPGIPGVESERVYTLRTVEDTLKLRAVVERTAPRRAVVVGGGFIGLEMAENLMQAGVQVTVVEGANQVMAPLDYDMACEVHAYLKSKGTALVLGETVQGFETREDGIVTRTSGGKALLADLCVLAIGVAPDTALAKDAGLSLGLRGAIVVDERMRTSVPDIYAVGDAVQVQNSISGQDALISLAGPANRQGRIAADDICGIARHYPGSQGSSVIKLFDMTVAATGLNEKAARAAGIPYDKALTFSASHATYYPGSSNMMVKTLYDPTTGRILGAQIVGFDGVDKRIDVLATAIRAQMTAQDLAELDLAYAPPYSSAKDPVNMAGFVIENVRSGLVRQFHWHDVACLPRDGSVTLLDVRTPVEYARGHIDGALNIPLDSLRERLDELPAQKPIYVNCHSGLRSYVACRMLSQRGFECYNLSGGYRFYERVTSDPAFDAEAAYPCGIKIGHK